MSIFAISDLHLSFGVDKPMNIFRGWDNYTNRIFSNWNRVVKDDDTVVLPGDFSWGMKMEETLKDFEFLNNLPGRKVLLKGNHDLWWSTAAKLRNFFEENKFSNIDIIFNNCITAEGYALAGTRGWFYDNSDKKVLNREAGRLEASIKSAEETGLPIIVFLHYPPVYGEFVCDEILNVLKTHNIKKVYYGHIHGYGFNKAVKNYGELELKLISCDCIDFTPFRVV